MSTYTRVLAALVIAAFSVGPVSAATVKDAPATTVAQGATAAEASTVAGTVRDDTGAPIVAASVRISGPHSYTATTDAAGKFSIADVGPGLYEISISRPGFDTARDEISVISGQLQNLDVRMHVATLTSLRTIASVRAVGSGTFNTTTASVNTVNTQTFENQSQPQVIHVLDEIPGVQISYPQGGGNAASPGAITFPNVRGALSFETATLLDGHPLSVGGYGDYVTSFMSSYLLGSVDVIKGPGAMSPQTNFAIGGTVNFRTKDPTLDPTPDYGFGLDNFGGTFFHFGYSDTIGRLGFVLGIADTQTNGGINNYPATIVPDGAVVNVGGVPTELGYNDTFDPNSPIRGTSSYAYNRVGLVACCYDVSGNYYSMSELLKLRYKFSSATTATVSYLGNQAKADQNANLGSQVYSLFEPTISAGPGQIYTGPIAPGSQVVYNASTYLVNNDEVNNEPILQAEVSTTLGNDTLLGRFYHAGIERLKTQGNANPAIPQTYDLTFNGIDSYGGVFNNVNEAAQFYSYYNNPEIDTLNGTSFEYEHPVADNTYSLSYEGTRTATTIGSYYANVSNAGTYGGLSAPDATVPSGSNQFFQTIRGRGQFTISPKLSAIVSLYDNLYQSTYLAGCGPVATPATCTYNENFQSTNGYFNTSNTSHFDERFALEFRPKTDLAVRLSAGSAIAPPYIDLLSQGLQPIEAKPGSPFATQDVGNPNLVPETAFGYDLGADYRFKDGITTASGDIYSTNLWNQFVEDYGNFTGEYCTTAKPPACGPTPNASTIPLVQLRNTNLNQARYQGIEARLTHVPTKGFGFVAQGAVTRGYAYNIPADFYCEVRTPGCTKNTLLGIVANQNFTGGVPAGYGYADSSGEGGVSNQNIPYLQAYGEINWNAPNGAYAMFGYNVTGKNNSLNEPPFGVAMAAVRYPVSKTVSVQVSGWNLFHVYTGLFPIVGGGVAVPLANGELGGTSAGQLGPTTYHFELTKTFGAQASDYNQ